MMEMATPVDIATISEEKALNELYDIMGAKYDPAKIKLLPKLISTGLPDIMAITTGSSEYMLSICLVKKKAIMAKIIPTPKATVKAKPITFLMFL